MSPRDNPPNTDFRRFYERGDLPIRAVHVSAGIRVGWKVRLNSALLDYQFYLPVFFTGLREVEEPYQSLALYGTQDLLRERSDRILPVIPQLILPIKDALETRDPVVIRRILLVLQDLTRSTPMAGEALVPYYRQILPILNMFKDKNRNLGDQMDFGQRRQDCLGDLIQETLELLEIHGGPSAYINIRYIFPSYQSVVFA